MTSIDHHSGRRFDLPVVIVLVAALSVARAATAGPGDLLGPWGQGARRFGGDSDYGLSGPFPKLRRSTRED